MILTNTDSLASLEELALGSRLKRLSDQLMRQASLIYEAQNIDFDPYHMPIYKLIAAEHDLTIGAISEALNVTQPAVTQYVNALVKRKLVSSTIGTIDKRRRLIRLTKKGEVLLDQLGPIWKIIDSELKEWTRCATQSSLLEQVSALEEKLNQQAFSTTVINKLMETLKNRVEIISYKDEYASHFRDLNLEWLETYFYVEEHDKEVLNNPKSYILDNGGYIFFAIYNGEVAGTVALINESEGYELSKMAVDPKFRGLKIGQELMKHCIDFASSKEWAELLLYSNTKLENAIYIYRKFGFKEVDLETDSPYERSDIKMKLSL